MFRWPITLIGGIILPNRASRLPNCFRCPVKTLGKCARQLCFPVFSQSCQYHIVGVSPCGTARIATFRAVIWIIGGQCRYAAGTPETGGIAQCRDKFRCSLLRGNFGKQRPKAANSATGKRLTVQKIGVEVRFLIEAQRIDGICDFSVLDAQFAFFRCTSEPSGNFSEIQCVERHLATGVAPAKLTIPEKRHFGLAVHPFK